MTRVRRRTRARSSRRAHSRHRAITPRGVMLAVLVAGLTLIPLVMILTNVSREGQPDAVAEPLPASPETAWDPGWPALPVAAARGPAITRPAYAFAARRDDILRYIPCYCGCEKVGHRSNLDCYVKGHTPDQQPI